jgi:RimJ/RimL family protein N-acetyltransferase
MTAPASELVVEWQADDVLLRLISPTPEEVRDHASALAEFYNEPKNRALLTNVHHFDAADVCEQFAEMRAEGGHPFLLFVDGVLMGDSDLRHVEGKTAEFAILVGPRGRQAKGLGTRFTLMVSAVAFERLGLDRLYASVRPENAGSLRMLGKVGFTLDTSPEARRFAEEEDDVCVSLDARTFTTRNPEALERILIALRDAPPA